MKPACGSRAVRSLSAVAAALETGAFVDPPNHTAACTRYQYSKSPHPAEALRRLCTTLSSARSGARSRLNRTRTVRGFAIPDIRPVADSA